MQSILARRRLTYWRAKHLSTAMQVAVGDDDKAKGSVELMEDVPPHKQILAEVR